MKKLILSSAFLAVLATAQMAHAITFSIAGTVGGAPTGVTLLNFDDLAVNSLGGAALASNGSYVGVTISPDGKVANGSVSGQYAAPFLSGGNGVGFGAGYASDQANGVDTTNYLTSGKYPSPGGSITLDFGTSLQYLGLLWGSIDGYNTLEFYNGNTLLGSLTGNDVVASPNGDQTLNGTYYININTDVAFTKVVAKSTEYAFEFDNVAFNETPVSVPDGGMTAALLGVAMSGLAWVRRNKVS